MKPAKTVAEIKNNSKQRMIRYRKQMTEKGYISTTIFLSKEHREELRRLGDEDGLTRAESAEHIFNSYLSSDDKNITRTSNTNKVKSPESTAIIENLKARIERQEKDAAEMRIKLNHLFEHGVRPPAEAVEVIVKEVDLFNNELQFEDKKQEQAKRQPPSVIKQADSEIIEVSGSEQRQTEVDPNPTDRQASSVLEQEQWKILERAELFKMILDVGKSIVNMTERAERMNTLKIKKPTLKKGVYVDHWTENDFRRYFSNAKVDLKKRSKGTEL